MQVNHLGTKLGDLTGISSIKEEPSVKCKATEWRRTPDIKTFSIVKYLEGHLMTRLYLEGTRQRKKNADYEMQAIKYWD